MTIICVYSDDILLLCVVVVVMATPTTEQKVRLEAKADGEQLPVVNLLLLQSSSFHIAVSERIVVTRGPLIISYSAVCRVERQTNTTSPPLIRPIRLLLLASCSLDYYST